MDNQITPTITELQPHESFHHNMAAVAKGSGFVLSGKLFMDAIRLVIAFILARTLGANQYGMYNLALSSMNVVVGLSLLGLDDAIIRFIAVMAGRKDEKAIWGSIQVGVGVATFISAIVGTIVFGYSYVLAERVFNNINLAPLLQLGAVFIPMLTVSEMLAGTLKGFKRMDYSVIARSYFQPLLRLVMVIIITFSGMDAFGATLAFCLSNLVACGLLVYYLNREFSIKRPLNDAKRDFKGIMAFSLPLWFSDIIVNFQSNIQALALGAMNTVTSVGVFSIASQITVVSGHFTSSLNISSKPYLAQLYDRRDMKQLEQIYQTANKWAVMVQLPIFFIMILFPHALLSVFGGSYTKGATALIILAIADLLNVSTGMGGAFLEMTGYAKLKLINSIVRLALYLGVDLLFIPRFGVIGAAMGVLAGEGAVNILRLIEVYVLFKLIPFNKGFIKPVIAAAIATASALVLGIFLSYENNFIHAVIGATFLLTVYVGTTYLLGFSEEEAFMFNGLRNQANKLIAKFKRSKK